MAKKRYFSVTVKEAIIAAIGLIMATVIGTGMNIWNNRSQLKLDNTEYISKISNLEKEVESLERKLIPFKIIALANYPGSEQEALRKLANELEELKTSVNPLKKPIAFVSANIEVMVKSDEQVNAKYPLSGGALAFVKNKESLLLVSNTSSTARQNGKDEVVYKGDFQIDTSRSAIGKPVEILQDSDVIKIMFNTIPENSKVLDGNASVVINGDLRLDFEILPQQMKGKNIFIHNIKSKFQRPN